MARPKIAVFSGPTSTIGNSATLVTSNKGRLPGEPLIPGSYDHLVPQRLSEPVLVKIQKFSAHPLEEDARAVYHDDGKDYYEVELRPEDGLFPLPYVARRADGSPSGAPFDEADLVNPALDYGGRQFFFPDASRLFEEINRTVTGRSEDGEGSILDRLAEYDFIRALPPGGYRTRGEAPGVDYFPYKPYAIGKTPRPKDLARLTNVVCQALASGQYAGAVWLEGSPTIEETLYWLSLLIDTDLPICGNAAQRMHGQLGNDGDRNIVDSVSYILSGKGGGLGAVGIQEERIFAAREFKKGDDRPGAYKATGGHGGILGSVGPPVTIWYRPAYKHTSGSEVNFRRLPEVLEFADRVGSGAPTRIRIKNPDGTLRGEAIPRVHFVKYGNYMEEDETQNPDNEVDIIARIAKAQAEQASGSGGVPQLHGLVYEGLNPYGSGGIGQINALTIAAFSGMPIVRVGRADPGGMVPRRFETMIAGSNLDANKARMLLMAAMMKLGRLPKARDPRDPTREEWDAVVTRVAEYQEIFDAH